MTSVKARVHSTVSDTRKSFTKTPILEANDPTPPVKTAVGISYGVISDQITATAEAAQKNGGVVMSANVQSLLDSLYAAPRLNQWHCIAYPGAPWEFRLYTNNDAIFVSVTSERIFLTKGIRQFDVFSGMAATALYNTIRLAQEIIQPVTLKPVMTDSEQEEYFSDEDTNGADIDSALADVDDPDAQGSQMKVTVDNDDDNLMEEALVEDQHALDGDQPIVTVSQQFIEDISDLPHETEISRIGLDGSKTVTYSEKTNQKNAKIDGVQCSYCGNLNNGAYRGPCPQCPKGQKLDSPKQSFPTLETTRVVAHLKSLQGQILNIVEAAIADKEQRKAVKTLINKTFRSKMNNLGAGWSDDEE